VDVSKANELFETAIRLAADAQTLRDELQVEFLSGQLAEVVATDYDLGDVLRDDPSSTQQRPANVNRD